MFSAHEDNTKGSQKTHTPHDGNVSAEDYTIIEPHFGCNVELFDNEEMFPDLELVVPGFETSLHLHKLILARASKLMEGLFKAKRVADSQDGNQVEWMFDTSEKVDRDALLKVLRFCYGENIRVRTTNCECYAVVLALYRLQVTCANDVVRELTDFSVNRAKMDLSFGVMLLKSSQHYQECRNKKAYELDKALAKALLTRNNICEQPETVVSDCLMKLPPEYLDMAEYGEPHTTWSEFNARAQYLKEHSEELSQEEKENIMKECNLMFLRSGELKELRKLNVVGSELILDMHESVLERTEKEKSDYGMEIFGVIRERDEYKKRAEEAEKERDELKDKVKAFEAKETESSCSEGENGLCHDSR